MTFDEILTNVIDLLQRDGRVSYRALKLRFNLDDEYIEGLKDELIAAKKLAADEDGKVLVWIGEGINGEKDKGITGSPEGEEGKWGKGEKEGTPGSWTPTHLAERIRAATVTDGERKTITALFADLKGSTALIEGLDPEEARAIIDPALQLMMDAVHRYEGYVAQALGDGIFALFGAPIAHEDHPQRALYAALRMQDEMRRYTDTLRTKGYPPLQMRVGLNTGEVVVRSIRKDDLHTDYVPVGHSTNLAARMEQLATPGAIVVSAYTHRLTDGYFAFKDLGPTQIKGVEEPLHIYEVLGVGSLRTKLQVAVRRGLTRFVGRKSEMEQLQHALAQAKAGHGQIVGVMGEPGLGKSRLFYEFVGAYDNTPLHAQSTCLILQAYSVSHGKASPYLPLIELLKSYFRLELQDDERTRREKVGGKVLMLDRSLEDTLPYLFALLGIEEQPSPLQQMDAQIRRRRTFEALKKLLLRESLNQPLVLISEDLHWIDGETQGFLDVLSESVASAKILLLTNYRPEYRHEWGQKTYYTQLRLAPFGKAEAEEFLDELLGEKGFPLPRGERDRERVNASPLHDLKHLILEKTEGTPFFMEEIVQELREQGVLPGVGETHASLLPTDLHIPPTVQGILAARIDRLAPDEKALLQQLAVIGREFPLSLIRHVLSQSEDELYRLLSSLQRKEFLYEQPAFPEVEYIFKHALTQDVAYNSVLHERRKTLHEQTARAIEALYSAALEDHYSELAHHYSCSGNLEKAVEYLGLAGQQAVQRSANVDAITHLTTALELLKTLPDTPEHAQQELTLQTAIGPALIAVKGYGSLEVARSYRRARELCRQIGETPQLYSTLLGVWVSHLIQADLQTARELGEQLLHLAQLTQDSSLLVGAHWAFGETLLFLGDLEPARVQLEQGLTFYDFQTHHTQAFQYGQDHGMTCLSFDSFVLWLLGYPDQALQRSHEATTLAQNLTHLNSQAFAMTISLWVFEFRRETNVVRERAEALIALAAEQGGALWNAWGTIFLGWALAEQGQRKEGIAHLQRGLVAFRETGAEMTRPHFLTLLAEMQGQVGQVKEGLAVLGEALAMVDKTGERWWEAELYRIKGTLMLQQASLEQVSYKFETSQEQSQASLRQGKTGQDKSENTDPRPLAPDPQGEAEVCFLKATDIARAQQAKSLELRATVSLARLWRSQGKRREAHSMLSAIYNWFTEGFDTKDLQEAKALLDELAVNQEGEIS